MIGENNSILSGLFHFIQMSTTLACAPPAKMAAAADQLPTPSSFVIALLDTQETLVGNIFKINTKTGLLKTKSVFWVIILNMIYTRVTSVMCIQVYVTYIGYGRV